MWLILIYFGHSHYVDESLHNRQINRFLNGNFEILSSLTTIPGYNLSIAAVSFLLGRPSSEWNRVISLLLSLPSVWVFLSVSKKLNARLPRIKTLQFLFLPISFFYFPLIYTDIFSLLMILLAFNFSLSKKYNISAFFSLASILVRQTNIVWVVFIWVFDYIQSNGFSVSREKIFHFVRRTAGYILIFVSFLVFALANKGIAIGDKGNHPIGIYRGNLYFFLFLTAVLFLPFLISAIRRPTWKKYGNFFIFSGTGALAAFSFAFFPPVLHDGNLKMHFLRNIVLDLAYHQSSWIYALAIFLGFFTFYFMNFKREYYILFAFIAASLLPSFLVEHRYSIVPMVFLLLLREQTDRRTEISLVFYFLVLSLALLFMLVRTNIFL